MPRSWFHATAVHVLLMSWYNAKSWNVAAGNPSRRAFAFDVRTEERVVAVWWTLVRPALVYQMPGQSASMFKVDRTDPV